MAKVIVFSAPSASGKSTLVNYLMAQGVPLHFSVSCANRKARPLYDGGPCEEHGVHYYFITPEEFAAHIDAGDFLEYEEVYPGRFYGTLRKEVDDRLTDGQNVICDVDVKGGVNIKRHYGDRCLSIFIQAPSIEEIERRLRGRGSDSEGDIQKRLARAAYELSFAPQFDRVIINDDLATAQAEILRVVTEFLHS